MPSLFAIVLFVAAVAAPAIQTACDESAGPPPDVFDGGADTSGVFTSGDGVRFRAQVIATNLEIPWALAFAEDGRLFVTERPGRLRIIEDGRLLDEPAVTLPDVFTDGEAGLLGVALDPDFTQNRFVYLFYTATRAGRDPVNRIVRFFEANNTLVDAVTILDDIPASRLHDGGRIRFGADGYLYATTGDALDPTSAQDLGVLTGKILRIARDGTTPGDNPFASQVYSFGHRNPQGIAWHPVSGDLWASEHGQVGNDEINRIEPGANYGWPTIEGVETMAGMRTPVLFFTPSVAPSGASFYTGTAFPSFRNDLFVATLRGSHLRRVTFSPTDPRVVTSNERLVEDRFGRLRDVVTGPDGALYFCTSNRDGRGTSSPDDDRVIRLVPDVGGA